MENEIVEDAEQNTQNPHNLLQIPNLIKTISECWTKDKISEDDFIKAAEFLIKKRIIVIE